MAFIKTKQVFHGTFVSVKEWHRSSIAASSVRCPSTSRASLTRSCRPSSPETCNHHCEGWGVCWNRILDKLFLCLLILSAETKAGGEVIQITNHWHRPVASPSVLSAVRVGLQSMSRLKTCSSWSNRWVEPHRPTVWAIEQEAASPSGSAGFHHSRRNTGCRIDFNLKHKTEKDRYCAWEPPQPCAAQNGTH